MAFLPRLTEGHQRNQGLRASLHFSMAWEVRLLWEAEAEHLAYLWYLVWREDLARLQKGQQEVLASMPAALAEPKWRRLAETILSRVWLSLVRH